MGFLHRGGRISWVRIYRGSNLRSQYPRRLWLLTSIAKGFMVQECRPPEIGVVSQATIERPILPRGGEHGVSHQPVRTGGRY